jgi:hypothetical protein
VVALAIEFAELTMVNPKTAKMTFILSLLDLQLRLNCRHLQNKGRIFKRASKETKKH